MKLFMNILSCRGKINLFSLFSQNIHEKGPCYCGEDGLFRVKQTFLMGFNIQFIRSFPKFKAFAYIVKGMKYVPSTSCGGFSAADV